MDILDDIRVSKLSAKAFFKTKVNYSFKMIHPPTKHEQTGANILQNLFLLPPLLSGGPPNERHRIQSKGLHSPLTLRHYAGTDIKGEFKVYESS